MTKAISEDAVLPPPAAPLVAVRQLWRPLAIYAVSRVWMLLTLLVLLAVRPATTLSGAMNSWDGAWYVGVAQDGYPNAIPEVGGQAVQSVLGFFPLFPLLIRPLHWLTGVSYLWSAEVIVTVSGAGFTVVLWSLMRHLFDARAADRATALVCFFPGFFVFALIYSEPISLFLSAVCLLALIRNQWWMAGISAGLATATRPNAVILVACCAWAAAMAIRQRREWIALVAPLLAPLGALIHFTFLYFRTGTFWAYTISQEEGWDLKIRPSTPGHLLGQFIGDPFAHGDVVLRLAGSVLIVVCALVLLRSHFPGVTVVYGLGVGVLDLFLVPSPRFVLTAFPLIAVVGQRLRGWWFALALVLSAGGLAGLLVLTVLGRTTP